MNWEAWVVLATIALVLIALARNLAGPDVVLLGASALFMTMSGVSDKFPSPSEIARTFGNEGLLTVGVLFVVALGLTETGGMSVLAERLLRRPSSVTHAQLRMMLPVAGISAFLNNTPVVAMFIPVISDWCRRMELSPSKLFIPLSYAAILGGCCTLIGTSTNLVVQGLMIEAQKTDPRMPIMGMFTIGAIGLPVALVGIVYILLASTRLLPERRSARTRSGNPREYTVEMLVEPHGAVDRQTIEQAGLRHLPGMYLMAVERGDERLVAVEPDQILHGGDRLIFVGIVDSVVDLHRVRGLLPATDQVNKLNDARHNRCLIEAVVSPTCPVVGQSIRDGRFRSRYDAVVIAVHRNAARVPGKIGDIVLKAGDTLLLEGHRRFLRHYRNNRDFLLVSEVEDSRPRRHDRAWIATAILAGLVIVVALETLTHVSVFNGALIAAGLMVATRCCSAEQARRSIEWPVLLAIAGALGVGRAMEQSGLANAVAHQLIGVLESAGPWAVLAGIYLITLVFTELVTNNAAAVLAFPLAHAAARGLEVNYMPFVIVVGIAASAGFATPIGYQTHLMVYGPGGYRFSDFARIGVPLDLLVMAVTVTLTPFIFPF